MKIAVVIPCYRVKTHISDVISRMGSEIGRIYVVDDACPENSGKAVEALQNSRIKVLYHQSNQGVGAAVMTGYKEALKDGADIIVKLDGDGQMDPNLISTLIKPITQGRADYTKGNRYFALENLSGMPAQRLFGNAILSFVTKASTGYWSVMDPTNGFTAIHSKVLKILPLEKLSPRYFFESDILFRLNCVRAVVQDVPMRSNYGEEKSNLNIFRAAIEFPIKHKINFLKRIFYNYFLRDFSIGTVQLLAGVPLLSFGVLFGAFKWIEGYKTQQLASAGTVLLAALPIILGIQLIISALNYDISREPKDSIHGLLE